ncbi:MAG: hypothetical protein U0798_11770 [Gemmataceae bacterium]
MLKFASCFAFLMLLAGCSAKGKVTDFTPNETNARKALEAALNQWQNGGPAGPIQNTDPKVEVTDSKWKSGLALKSYEITGEEPWAKVGPRFFTVRLTMAKGNPVETKYAVLGIDPLLIYRDEDYQKLTGTGR